MIVRPENHTERPERVAPFRVRNSPYILREVKEPRRLPGDSNSTLRATEPRAFEGQGGAAKGELP
jgi:hypothetical protein